MMMQTVARTPLHTRTFFKRSVPLVLQSEAAECGLACVAMIAKFYGDKRDLSAFRQNTSLSIRGTTLKDIMDIALHFGLQSRAVKIEMTDLNALTTPAILHWDMNHFVVLSKVTKNTITILDPASGKHTYSFKEAAKHISGIALEISPSSTFAPVTSTGNITVMQFLKQTVGFKRSLLTLFTLSVLLQVFALASPYYMQTVVDDVLVYHNASLLKALVIGFGFLLLIETLTSVLRRLLILNISSRLQLQMSASVFKHLMSLSLDYFAKRHIGDVVSRFNSLSHIREFLTSGVVSALLDGLMAITTLVVMAIYSLKLALLVLFIITVYLCIKLGLLPWMKRLTAEKISLAAHEQSHFMESVRAISPIRIYKQEAKRQGDWQNKFVDALNKDIQLGKLNIGSTTANHLLFGIENLTIVYIGALLVMQGALTIGMLLAFIAYKSRFVSAIDNFTTQLIELKMLGVHIERLSDIIRTPSAPKAVNSSPLPLLTARNPKQEAHLAIEVDNIHYRFSRTSDFIFRQLSMSVTSGEIVAIVGASGSGKSTLMKCLMGLYPLTSGKVTINAPNGKSRPARIASVLQDDVCLSGTIIQNISCFDDNPDLEKIAYAAQLACVHRDILAMPMQYQSLIGDMGSSLSGGQKQRLLLARALYQSPDILFLDEASSHLDLASEKQINAHLKALNITRIMIAHRPQTIAIADTVYHLANSTLTQLSPSDVREITLQQMSGENR